MFRNYCVLRSPEPAPSGGGGLKSNQAVKKEIKKVNGVQKSKKAPKVPAQKDSPIVDLDIPVGIFNIRDLKFKSGPVPESLKGNAIRLLTELDKLCTMLKVGRDAVSIISGYRSPAYNEGIDGAKKSQHMEATAVDFNVAGYDPKALFKEIYNAVQAGSLAFHGLGLYDGWVHADVREGSLITWYDTSDKVLLSASKKSKSSVLKLILGG